MQNRYLNFKSNKSLKIIETKINEYERKYNEIKIAFLKFDLFN